MSYTHSTRHIYILYYIPMYYTCVMTSGDLFLLPIKNRLHIHVRILLYIIVVYIHNNIYLLKEWNKRLVR